MKKSITLILLACMLLSSCGTPTPSDDDIGTLPPETTSSPESNITHETTAPPETADNDVEVTTQPPETTSAPDIDIVPDITLWDKESDPLTDLLSMNVADIKAKYGELTLSASESAVGRSVYEVQNFDGVLLVFENRDMSLPLSDALLPDSLTVTEEYVGKVAGISVGEIGEDVAWNDASCAKEPITYLYGRDHILAATRAETEETFPEGYPGTAGEDFALWRENFCLDPVGEIIGITLEKRRSEQSSGGFSVISNLYGTSVHSVEIPLRTENATYEVFDLDDRYALYVVKNKNIKYYVNMNPDTYSVELFVVDSLEGKIVYDGELAKVTEGYGYGGCNVVFLHTEKGGELALWESSFDKLTAAYDIVAADGTVKVTKKDRADPIPDRERFTSPDGRYTVFNVRESPVDNDGGIDLLMPDGSYTRILTNKPGGEHCRGYTVCGFIDDTTFAYSITGWEYVFGYGTYNIATGENKEYLGDDILKAASGGYVYVTEVERYNFDGMYGSKALCSIDTNGVKKRLAATTVYRLEDGKRIYLSEAKAGEVDLTDARLFFEGTGWIVIDDRVNFYSADLSKLLVSIDPPDDYRIYDNVHVYNRVITIVTPKYK